jgi:hypothetical protein
MRSSIAHLARVFSPLATTVTSAPVRAIYPADDGHRQWFYGHQQWFYDVPPLPLSSSPSSFPTDQ